MVRSRGPYGLEIIQNCCSCPVREDRIFCRLSPEALVEQNAIRQVSLYPGGAVLFVKGQPCQGIFVVCSGTVKLTATSKQGNAVILQVVEAGEVLGLSEVLSDTPYEVTAETLEPTETSFLPREPFLRFLERHGEVSLRVAQYLSANLRRAHHQVMRIALAPSARGKLAGLLLDWAGNDGRKVASGVCFPLRFNHEEIGELIGSSRETVTRVLGELRREGLIDVKKSLVTLLSPDKLETELP